ncbi:hypothetical protein TIFTF001_022386 [Ficus carica]|uniref:Uncharacterized protein n=1 Tax=Ficus carica TaxID=3494 RepID=A0AA88DEG7_FICCA|nr:hypothetical protein TIFTF001_022386 [Ficus carica]
MSWHNNELCSSARFHPKITNSWSKSDIVKRPYKNQKIDSFGLGCSQLTIKGQLSLHHITNPLLIALACTLRGRPASCQCLLKIMITPKEVNPITVDVAIPLSSPSPSPVGTSSNQEHKRDRGKERKGKRNQVERVKLGK